MNRSPHYQTLCLTLSDRSDQVDWDALSQGDWDALGRLAVGEGVGPLVHQTLERLNVHHTNAFLSQSYYHSAAQTALFGPALEMVLQDLGSQEIPVIVLKGAALARDIYPDPALRPMVDLDLLIHRPDLERACLALESLGYQPTLPEMATGINLAAGYNLEFCAQESETLKVELHWNLVAGDTDRRSPPLDWFWEQTLPWPTGPSPFARRLNPTAHLLYLAAHLALKHGTDQAQLLWYVDLHRMVNHYGDQLDWEMLSDQAQAFHWSGALHAALNGTVERFNTPLPPGFLAALSESSSPIEAGQLDRKATAVGTRTLAVWNDLAELDWPARLRVVAAQVFPRPAYLRWRYGLQPPWDWLLGYPIRWVDLLRDGVQSLRVLVLRRGRAEGETVAQERQVSVK